MLGHSKYGKSAFLELKTDYNFKDSLITYFADSSMFLHISEEIKLPKTNRRTNYEIAIIHLIIYQFYKKYEDSMSTFCREQSKVNSYYFNTCDVRVCPHGLADEQDNFIVN